MIIGIMAATPEGVIGRDGGLPWDYPDELNHFKRTTLGHPVIMGRRTFESCPATFLQAREPIVLSRSGLSLDECLSLVGSRTAYMIGGAEVAHLFLDRHLLSSFILTRIHHSYPGDTRIDLSRLAGWPEEFLISNPAFSIVNITLFLSLSNT